MPLPTPTVAPREAIAGMPLTASGATIGGMPFVAPSAAQFVTSPLVNGVREEDLCGQCQVDGASKFCRECKERFCTSCSSDLHKRGRMREHRLVPYSPGMDENSSYTDANGGAGDMSSGDFSKGKSPMLNINV